MDKNTTQAKNQAYTLLQAKIDKELNKNVLEYTVSQAMDMYVDDCKKRLKESSYDVEKMTSKVLKEKIGNYKIADINAKHVYIFLDLKETGKNFRYRFVKRFLKWCYSRDLIEDIKFLDKIKMPKIDSLNHDKLYLEKEELQDILKFFEDDTVLHNLIILLVNIGLRIGETLALTYNDLQGDTLTINKTLTRKRSTTSPKTEESDRKIAVNQDVINVIKSQKALNSLKKVIDINGFLFVNRNGKPIHHTGISVKLKRYKKINLHPHIFRHTHASLLIEQGVSVDAVSRRLGHKDTTITQQIYIHMTEKLKQKEDDIFRNIKIL